MHPSAQLNSKQFFDCYASFIQSNNQLTAIEIGSQDVNGSLRGNCPDKFNYIGVDFVEGKGVDVILDDPYILPFEDNSADIVISSSCFEHSEMFWLVFLEIMRILKPHGLFYLNVPSNGTIHRWPVDCWRFYPDSGGALVTWAKRNGMHPMLLESYTSTQVGDQWNDYVAVFLKDESFSKYYPNRIVDTKIDFYNGLSSKSEGFLRYSENPEDKRKMMVVKQIIDNQIKIV
jgi:SAM-dependent methyltransferase